MSIPPVQDEDITAVSVISSLNKPKNWQEWEDETTVKTKFFDPAPKYQVYLTGAFRTAPIVMGYIPLAMAYGVMAYEAGLSLWATVLMSLLVFAGSAQFIAVGLISQGQAVIAIAITTFVVNFRHLLLATSITQHLAKWKPWQRLLFSLQLTDETYALHSAHYLKHRAQFSESISSNICAHSAWLLGSFLGYVMGSAFKDFKAFGLDYALPAMFIGILISQIQNRLTVWIAVIAGGLSVCLKLTGFTTSAAIIATLIAATLGLVLELWKHKS